MSKKTLLAGEPMGLFIAQNKGHLDEVSGYSMTIAGAEFNVAVGMRRLNHEVGYLTKLGKDPFGKRILKIMADNGISTELIIQTDERNTGFMLKSMVDIGDPEIYYYRSNSAASTLCAKDAEGLDFSQYDALHLTGITPALTDSAREFIAALWEKARQKDIMISFDPNLRLQLWKDKDVMIKYMNEMAGKSDIFFPGKNEARILTGETDPEKVAQIYLDLGAKAVIVKLEEDGAYYATANEHGFVPAYTVVHVVDTVGAGDGFAAGVLSALKENLSWKEAVRRGNAVGAIQVMSRGDNDGLPTREELEDFMAGKPDWRKNNE